MERVPLLTFASLANVRGGAAVITTVAVAWTVMAFRAEDATIVQTFNDLGFFLYAWPPFGIWMVIIAIAILRDVNQKQTFPRWVAYYNLYAAIGMAPASLMGLFKTGPLAYQRGPCVLGRSCGFLRLNGGDVDRHDEEDRPRRGTVASNAGLTSRTRS